LVWNGRREFMRQFTQYALPSAQERIANPADPATFEGSKLDPADRSRNHTTLDLYRDLLRIRREDPVISRQAREDIEGAVLADRALLVRWIDDRHGDRLLLVNLDAQLDLHPAPEPLLAPPVGRAWSLAWSSDEPRYGGPGALRPCDSEGWRVPAESASLLIARESESTSFA
jgi:maltooligosyltrehalose trehalohydrolase